MAIHPKPIERHIHERAQNRLCDGAPAGKADISSEDLFDLHDARRDATTHLHAVPVLKGPTRRGTAITADEAPTLTARHGASSGRQ